MGVFGVFFGCRGDGSFNGPLLGVCSGVVGFNVAVFLTPVRDIFRPASPAPAAVREKVRPAALWSSCKREKFRPAHENGPKWVFYAALGELLRGNAAGGAALGELLRGNAAGGAALGEFFADQQSWGPAGRVCCTVCLAAGPFCWHP